MLRNEVGENNIQNQKRSLYRLLRRAQSDASRWIYRKMKIIMSYKKFCIIGLVLVCGLMAPSILSNYPNYRKTVPDYFGSPTDQAARTQKIEQLDVIEEVKEQARKYVDYAYDQERRIKRLHENVKGGWVYFSFVWIGLCLFFLFGYRSARKQKESNQSTHSITGSAGSE
jgi:hypothetical protein